MNTQILVAIFHANILGSKNKYKLSGQMDPVLRNQTLAGNINVSTVNCSVLWKVPKLMPRDRHLLDEQGLGEKLE